MPALHDEAAIVRPNTEGEARVSTEGALMVTIGAGSACSATECTAGARVPAPETTTWNVVRLNGRSSGDTTKRGLLLVWSSELTAPSRDHVKFSAFDAKPKEPEASRVKVSVAQRPTDVGPRMTAVGLAGGGRFDVWGDTHWLTSTAPAARVVSPAGHAAHALGESDQLLEYEAKSHGKQVDDAAL